MSDNMSDDRYFDNEFPDYDDLNQLVDLNGQLTEQTRDSILRGIEQLFVDWIKHCPSRSSEDSSVYTGNAGAALLYWKLSQVSNILEGKLRYTQSELVQSAEQIIDRCINKIASSSKSRVTFLCGKSGVLALKAILMSQHDGQQNVNTWLQAVADIVHHTYNDVHLPDELLYGRVGVLYTLLFLRSNIDSSNEILNDQLIRGLVNRILESGQRTAQREASSTPLFYYWHDKAYIGAAHGFAGILYMLLEARHYLTQQQLSQLVKPTIDWICFLQFQSGNFPSSLNSNGPDRLVHWCHGAPGVIHLLCLAYQVFNNEPTYLQAALKGGDDIWRRGLLRKGFGICHGVAGNGYAFLRLYQLTKQPKHLYRAARFAEWCCSADARARVVNVPDRPYSMFEGCAGTIYFLVDILTPEKAQFPAFQLST